MDSGRAERFAEGLAAPEEMSGEERAIDALVRKSARAPACLEPPDLSPLVGEVGLSGALEAVAMLGHFHFINRIADLVGIESELPIVQRRWASLRKLGVRLQAAVMKRAVDLSNRPITADVDELLGEVETIRGEPLPAGYSALRQAPNVAAWAHCMTVPLSTLDTELLARVTEAVAAALPSNDEESTGFHARPADPVDELVFVGTRYAARTTDELVGNVRRTTGWGDAELTDVFFAIGARNAFERVDRLLASVPTA